MTREKAKDIVLNYALGQKINDGINTLDELIDRIFDEHEVQLKAKENHIVELNKMVKAKDEQIEILQISSHGFECLYDDYKMLSRKIVAMLFWEWKKAVSKRKYKEQIKKEHCDHHDNPIAYYYAHEEMALWNFRKSYAMLKDK